VIVAGFATVRDPDDDSADRVVDQPEADREARGHPGDPKVPPERRRSACRHGGMVGRPAADLNLQG